MAVSRDAPPKRRGSRPVALYFAPAIAVALFLFVRGNGGGPRPPSDPSPPAPVSSAEPSPSPLPPVVAPTGGDASGPRASSPPRALPRVGAPPSASTGGSEGASNLVEFEVRNGLAIAFGDVILGRPPEGSDLQHGRAEVYPPDGWPGGEIPYAIAADLPNPARVEQAIDYFNRNTPIRFIPYRNQPDAVLFERGPDHCYSLVGKQGGIQPVQLSTECGPAEIIHELMHALGFVHEQMRTDRDQFIEVLWDNIDPKFRRQFEIGPEVFMEPVRGTPFDFHSAMLYRPEAFAARAGQPTMRSRGAEPIAPVTAGLSEGDLYRLRRMYRR